MTPARRPNDVGTSGDPEPRPSMLIDGAPTVAEKAAGVLRELIRSGEFEPGVPLRQRDIAEQLGISITPVREAFGLLEREGLVKRTTNRGVVVFRPSAEDLMNAWEVRGELEALAARRAAERIDEPGLTELRSIFEAMAEVDRDSDYVALNERFHAQIGRVAGNQRLAELLGRERLATSAYIMFLGVQRARAEETQLEHMKILEALEAHDGEAAAVAMRHHLARRGMELNQQLVDLG